MQTKKEIDKSLYEAVLKFKQVEEKEKIIDQDNKTDVEKIKRLKSYLAVQIKDLKEQSLKAEKISKWAEEIEQSEKSTTKVDVKANSKEGQIKYRVVLLPIYILLFFSTLLLLFQKYLYNVALIKSSESTSPALENYYFFTKMTLSILFILFTITIINMKYVKKKKTIIFMTYIGIFLGIFSLLKLNTTVKVINAISTGNGFGVIGGVFLFISLFYLCKEFKYKAIKTNMTLKEEEGNLKKSM